MKRIIFLTVFLLISLASFAQTPTEHLTFKGVPIDGTLSEFVTKMKNAGFSHIGTKDGVALLSGNFAGYRDCAIGVHASKETKTINTVAVIFPERDNWSSLEDNYESLKSMLTQKYGEPANCVEKFQTYTQPNSDNDKLYHLKMDRCTYYTTFETPNGNIELSLKNNNSIHCFVILQYWDKINTSVVKKQAIEDL